MWRLLQHATAGIFTDCSFQVQMDSEEPASPQNLVQKAVGLAGVAIDKATDWALQVAPRGTSRPTVRLLF